MKRSARLAVAAVSALLFLPAFAAAQDADGFLFSPPRVAISLKSGYDFPRAESELFDYTIDEFTIDRADFGSPYIGGEVAIRAAEHLDIVTDFGWTRSRKDTEYRGWEDLDGLPIEQETLFERATLGLGVRLYPLDRGRQVGQFAFVPRTVSPFVGVSGGVMWHEFSQVGDFIDFDTLDVFSDSVATSSASPVGDVRAGVDVNLTPRVFVTGEFRYRFGSGPTGDDYIGFDDTDLAGFLALFGIGVRF